MVCVILYFAGYFLLNSLLKTPGDPGVLLSWIYLLGPIIIAYHVTKKIRNSVFRNNLKK